MPLDPTLPPDAKDPDQEFYGKVMRCMKAAYPMLDRLHGEHVARYEKEDGAPGGDDNDADDANPGTPGLNDLPPSPDDEPTDEQLAMNGPDNAPSPAAAPGANSTYVPGMGDKDKEKLRMSKPETDAVRYARMEKRVQDLERQNASFREQASQAQAQACVQQLRHEGYALDPKKELLRFSKLDQAGRAERMEEIRANYRRADMDDAPPENFALNFNPPGLPTPPEGDGVKRYSKAQVEKARDISLAKGIEYDEALKLVAAG